jgi:hypothetical protein
MATEEKPAYVPVAPDVSSFKNAIAVHSIGEGLEVIIYGSLGRTLDLAEREINNKQVVNAYRFLSGDERLDFSMIAARKVVLYEVQSAWYEANGKDIPQSVMSSQESILREAMVATKQKDEAAAAAGEKKAKEPRVTVKSIIEAGLRAGTANEEILKQVKKVFPDGKADDSHVRYYRHFLVKAGELEKLPRVTKPKAEKAQKTVTEAAKGDAPKASGSKPTKATSSKGAAKKA